MEKENRKLRDAAKRKYQEAVRALVDFVKKRDKRVIQHQVRACVVCFVFGWGGVGCARCLWGV